MQEANWQVKKKNTKFSKSSFFKNYNYTSDSRSLHPSSDTPTSRHRDTPTLRPAGPTSGGPPSGGPPNGGPPSGDSSSRGPSNGSSPSSGPPSSGTPSGGPPRGGPLTRRPSNPPAL
ncbi:unnamed protein product, partial [Brenthis ino]